MVGIHYIKERERERERERMSEIINKLEYLIHYDECDKSLLVESDKNTIVVFVFYHHNPEWCEALLASCHPYFLHSQSRI